MRIRFLALLSILLILVTSTSPLVAVKAPALTEWSLPTGQMPLGIVADHDGKIWCACGNGVIGQLDPPTNTFTEWSVVAAANNPARLGVYEGTKVDGSLPVVYFTDRGGNSLGTLWLDGDLVGAVGIPTSNSGPFGFSLLFPTPYHPFDPPTSILFTEEVGNKIGRFDLGKSQYVPLGATRSSGTVSPTFAPVIPETNVVTPMVTPGNPNLPPPIALATPILSGPFTEWALPSFMTNSRPMAIVADDVGYWFTTSRNYLGRLVGNDKIYVFGLPTASARTIDLKFDWTYQNLWYTAGDFNFGNPPDIIGRLELATGTITEWTVPTAGSTPFSLAVDISGMVWFTEYNGNKIGRLDPSTNTFWEFPVPNARPAGLSIDSHGTIWFTEWSTSKVVGLSPVGEMVPEFPVNMAMLIAAASVAILLVRKVRKFDIRR